MYGSAASLTLCKPDGATVANWPIANEAISLEGKLPNGIYFFFITDEQGHKLSSGKLVIK
jgi:hypothetical protein